MSDAAVATEYRAGVVRVTPELLAHVLRFAAGSRVTEVGDGLHLPVHVSAQQPYLLLTVEGPDMPVVAEGEVLPEVRPYYELVDGEPRLVRVDRA